ncbi:MAG: HTTM domain-containing protein [Planctomycetia bacterium]|nr:HTTM domain-containing protein [Planctomycetia bacterium]
MAATSEALNGRSESGFNKFFFAREIPYGMALARISLPLVLLVDIVRRWGFSREIYSTDGAIATLHANFGQPDLLPELPAPAAVGLFTLLGALLVTSALGWRTRLSLFGACGLYVYFSFMDCLSTVTKYTVIAQHVLFLLALSNCGELWSVDAWIARRRGIRLDLRAPIWPQRLVQILFGMIYFGAGITKMHTEGFFTGDQLVFWMMTYINNEHPLGDHLTRYPLIVSISCYTTFIWEIVFIFTVFQQRLRWWMLAIGTIFHIMTVFTLGLIIFPVVITASYLVFLSEEDVKKIVGWRPFRGLARYLVDAPEAAGQSAVSRPAPARGAFGSFAVFAMTMAVISFAGIECEYLLDHYKTRGPGGPLPLLEIAREDVERMLAPEQPLRQSDKLMAFDMGSVLVGEHLASHRTQYHPGERFVAQVSLNPPHEDMWLECSMCESMPGEDDEEGRLVPGRILYKTGLIMLRESFRTNFLFTIDNGIAPGEYFLKLYSANEEVARKRFTVLPGKIRAASAD